MADKLKLVNLGMPHQLAEEVANQIEGGGGSGGGNATQPPYIPFEGRSQAQSTVVPDNIQFINVAGLEYVRDASGTALTTAGGINWSPFGDGHPEHWGATGIEANSATIFQDMLDWCGANPNRKIVDTFTGARRFTSGMVTNGHVNWDAGSATYIQAHDSNFLIANGNENPAVVAIDSDYVIGSTEISVELPVIPQRGDWLRVVSNAVNPNDRSRIGVNIKYRIQEWVQAGEGSTSDTVVLSRPLRFTEGVNDAEDEVIESYTVAMNCRVCLIDDSKKYKFTGGRIEQEGPRTGPVLGLRVHAYVNPSITGTTFHNFYGSTVSLNGTIGALVDRCVFGEVADQEDSPTQQGYGVSDGGENTIVSRCSFKKCRHAYSSLRNSVAPNTNSVFASGNTVGGLIKECVAIGCTSRAFDTHHGSVEITFENCRAEGGGTSGFGGRGVGHAVRNCRTVMSAQGFECLVEALGNAGQLDQYATSFLIDGCDFQSTGFPLYARNSRVTIRDTVFRSPQVRQIQCVNSFVNIEGDVRFAVSDFNGAYPVITPASSSPITVTTGSVSFGGASSLEVTKSGVLTVDLSALPSMPVSFMTPASGTTIRVFGTLRAAVKDNVTIMTVSADRLIASPTSEFELILPASGVTLGTATNKFGHEYDSDGEEL